MPWGCGGATRGTTRPWVIHPTADLAKSDLPVAPCPWLESPRLSGPSKCLCERSAPRVCAPHPPGAMLTVRSASGPGSEAPHEGARVTLTRGQDHSGAVVGFLHLEVVARSRFPGHSPIGATGAVRGSPPHISPASGPSFSPSPAPLFPRPSARSGPGNAPRAWAGEPRAAGASPLLVQQCGKKREKDQILLDTKENK